MWIRPALLRHFIGFRGSIGVLSGGFERTWNGAESAYVWKGMLSCGSRLVESESRLVEASRASRFESQLVDSDSTTNRDSRDAASTSHDSPASASSTSTRITICC